MAKRAHFKVSFTIPDGATAADALQYVHDALGTYCFALAPAGGNYEEPEQAEEFVDGDPMRPLDTETIKVVATKR